jgi:hypothetical protein
MIKENWVKEDNHQTHHKKAKKRLEEIKDQRKNKKYKMVKINDNPPTYTEVEIKD